MHAEVHDLYPVTWNVFLETLIPRVEYTMIYKKKIPSDIRERYHIEVIIAADGCV